MSALGAPRAKLIVSEAIALDDSDTCRVKPEPPIEVIRRGLELFNEGEYERSIATLPPEIEWDTTHAVPDGGLYAGADQVVGYWRSVGRRWDDLRIEVDRLIEGEDVVLMLGRLVGRGAESGVPVENAWDQVWRIRDGQPVRCENYTDEARAWRESGLKPDAAR
jgi:ketosteroid isomerase-like protein